MQSLPNSTLLQKILGQGSLSGKTIASPSTGAIIKAQFLGEAGDDEKSIYFFRFVSNEPVLVYWDVCAWGDEIMTNLNLNPGDIIEGQINNIKINCQGRPGCFLNTNSIKVLNRVPEGPFNLKCQSLGKPDEKGEFLYIFEPKDEMPFSKHYNFLAFGTKMKTPLTVGTIVKADLEEIIVGKGDHLGMFLDCNTIKVV